MHIKQFKQPKNNVFLKTAWYGLHHPYLQRTTVVCQQQTSRAASGDLWQAVSQPGTSSGYLTCCRQTGWRSGWHDLCRHAEIMLAYTAHAKTPFLYPGRASQLNMLLQTPMQGTEAAT